MDLYTTITALVLGGMAWDALRRFAGTTDQADMDEIEERLDQTDLDTVSAHQRLTSLEERVSKHGETLTKLGLGKLGKGQP